MTRYTLILILIITNEFVFAQDIIKGKIVDSKTKKALPNCSIQILHRKMATVSDKNGNFELNIKDALPNDTLKMSYIGYSPLILPLNTNTDTKLYDVTQFEMDSNIGNLNEVEIKPKKIKTKYIGNRIYSSMVATGLPPTYLGTEFGTVLQYNKKNPGQIIDVNFNFDGTKYDSLLFIFHLYKYKDGLIGDSILKEPIYLKTKNKSEIFTLDWSKMNIFIDSDSFLSLEWIEGYGKFPEEEMNWAKMWYRASFFGNDSYMKRTNKSKWSKCGVKLGLWATVKYKK